MADMRLNDLASVVSELDRRGRLTRVTASVDLRHELAGLAAALETRRRPVLFERVRDHSHPVLAGLYAGRGVLAAILGRDEPGLTRHIAACIAACEAVRRPPVVVGGPILDVSEREVDLRTIPIPTLTLADETPSLTAALALAKDPETGARHASMHRFEIVGPDRLRAGAVAEGPLEAPLAKARKIGRNLWFTLSSGVSPALQVAAAVPAWGVASATDALCLAGEILGEPIALAPGTESDVEMIAHAMWAFECEIAAEDCASARPLAHVRRIHRRSGPIFHALLPGPETWTLSGLAGEARLLASLQTQIPGIRDAHLTRGGRGAHAVVRMRPVRAGSPQQALLAAFACCPPLRMVTIVDADVDLRSAESVEAALATRLDPGKGIVTIDGAGLGPKLGFDATQGFPASDAAQFKAVNLDDYGIAKAGGGSADAASEPAPTPPATVAPARPGDFDTSRIWQREMAEWRKGKSSGAAPTPASSDWDETRWWRRAMADMQAEKPVVAKPSAVEPPQRQAPRPAAANVPETPDWDENRWWRREMAELNESSAEKARPAPARASSSAKKASPPPPAAEPPVALAAKPPAAAEGRAPDDEEGGFFSGGAP
jgi:2,5-furandicarboxylate decarboxylase 1